MATSLGQSTRQVPAGPALATPTPTATPVPVSATTPLTTPIMAAQVVSLTAGQSMSLTVQTSNLSDLTALVEVNLGPTDTRPVLTLTSPSGAVSTAGAPQPGVGYADNSYGGPLPFLAFSTQNPQNGTWTLTVTNPATSTVNPLPLVANFITNSATGLALSAGTDQPAYLPGQTVSLTATLTLVNADGSTQPLGANTGATATAQLTSLLDPTFAPQTLTLYDDGQHGDGAPNDGVYGITFTAPSALGDYQLGVTAVGGGSQRVAQVPVQVQPLTPPVPVQITLNPPVGAPGASFGITSTACFTPNETVALTMSNVLLGTVQADATGAISATERVPFGLNGEEPVTATGQSSGVVATAPFGVILPPPALTLSRASGKYGTTVTITGTDFGASEPISLYLDLTGTAPLSHTTSLTSGAFVDTFSVPQAISGTHSLIALGASSGLTATVPFTILPAAVLLHAQGTGGAKNVLYGTGFGPSELVRGYWNKQPFTVTATTTALGSFGLSFTVPFSPAGAYAVYGVGQSSKAFGLAFFTIKPALYLKPASGKAGSKVQVVGTGYGAHETVTLKDDCATPSCASTTVLGTPTTNGNGIFATTVTIPVSSSTGAHSIGAKGGTSGVFATSSFTVTP